MEAIAARAALYLTLLPAAGLPLWLATAGRREPVPGRYRLAVGILAGFAALASTWSALAMIAEMTAQPITALDCETIAMVAGATPIGATTLGRVAGLGVLVLPLPRALAALAATATLATLAFAGHAGASEGTTGIWHRLIDTAHLATAACWIGTLLALLAAAWTRSVTKLWGSLANFATTGSVIVAVLVVTGFANALLIAGWPPPVHAAWTLALTIKLALFAAMLSLAALNRWKLTAALAHAGPATLRHIRISLAIETLLGLAVLVVVGWLGLLDPTG